MAQDRSGTGRKRLAPVWHSEFVMGKGKKNKKESEKKGDNGDLEKQNGGQSNDTEGVNNRNTPKKGLQKEPVDMGSGKVSFPTEEALVVQMAPNLLGTHH